MQFDCMIYLPGYSTLPGSLSACGANPSWIIAISANLYEHQKISSYILVNFEVNLKTDVIYTSLALKR